MDWQVILWCVGGAILALVVWRMFDAIREKKDRRWLRKAVADAKAGKLPETSLEDPKNGVISMTEDGFSVCKGDKRIAEVKWHNVKEIRAYKADLFSRDLICWGFWRSGDDCPTEVNEEMAGFAGLQEAVQSRYGVTADDWWSGMALPPFATNMTVIWSKQGSTEPLPPAEGEKSGASPPSASGG